MLLMPLDSGSWTPDGRFVSSTTNDLTQPTGDEGVETDVQKFADRA
jgi:hypothetical protein